LGASSQGAKWDISYGVNWDTVPVHPTLSQFTLFYKKNKIIIGLDLLKIIFEIK